MRYFFHFLLLPEGCSVKPRNAFCFPHFNVLLFNDLQTAFLRCLSSTHLYLTLTHAQFLSGIPHSHTHTHTMATFFGHFLQKQIKTYSFCHGSQHSPRTRSVNTPVVLRESGLHQQEWSQHWAGWGGACLLIPSLGKISVSQPFAWDALWWPKAPFSWHFRVM